MIERHETSSASGTEALGGALACTLAAGDLVLVEGEMGSGKTTFVRGAARALGVEGPVTSPTFTIGRRYDGPIAVAHLDLHRLGSLAGEEPALLEDYLDPHTVSFVEWPAVAVSAGALGPPAARVRLAHLGGDRRAVEIER